MVLHTVENVSEKIVYKKNTRSNFFQKKILLVIFFLAAHFNCEDCLQRSRSTEDKVSCALLVSKLIAGSLFLFSRSQQGLRGETI